MQKEILIAIDDSVHSQYAVQYAISMSKVAKNLHYRLLKIQPTVSQYIIEEAQRKASERAKLRKLMDQNKEKAQAVLDRFKKLMIDQGIAEGRIKTVSRARLDGVAKDILDYSLQEKMDAVVVGRRGVSKVQEMLVGSVTSKLMEHSVVTPMWVVDDQKEFSNILLAVDGSESALRAVDHISFILQGNADVTITILHVTPKFGDVSMVDFEMLPDNEIGELVIRGDKRRIDNFFGHASRIFSQAGIRSDQLDIRNVKCHVNVKKTIIEEARKGNFKTIVVGRSGINKSFFFGSVSRYVVEKSFGCAIWLVP